jgi:hypothetical protein
MSQTVDNATLDPEGLQRVLGVFERNYRLSSEDFYRAHIRNEPPAADVSAWHREIWSGTYRQWLRRQGSPELWRSVS